MPYLTLYREERSQNLEKVPQNFMELFNVDEKPTPHKQTKLTAKFP